MPLSEREQRMLKQLEEQLQSEDPSFASSMQDSPSGSLNVRNIVLGALVAVLGIVVLLLSIYNQWIPVGVIGFLIMGAGVYYATTGGASGNSRGNGGGGNGGNGGGGGGGGPRSSAPSPSGNFMTGLEQRWEERRRQD
ncbi:DUF3040 domain-containing protein [Nesterenkonia sp. E16_7]|uniref:DUF3040 domain-containing protein n=1 Tax=unclassified Nesterenkonia TaxID=2629769 RepID=UPI001A927B1D|nr:MULTISPECIES: DUF3040 domain-containing protein [unclassified Nesterenkonia]MBO0595097.1 DUF3040 domain-containing protein [Nesterenkonia sp. E16_10]MBO0598752.1 DUF3040 domain-containing protein [Nesterenkonia sp. E16_7]